jgi:VIT1/CCC1 family predicted Fe2+/Mn2+ transporter/rubrerythrin
MDEIPMRPAPPPSKAMLARYRSNWQSEVDSAAIYRAMAVAEPQADLAALYRRLAQAEDGHALFWQRRLEQALGQPLQPRTSTRARVLIWLAGRLGANAVLPTVMSQEADNRGSYDKQAETRSTAMPAQERSHARLLAHLASRARHCWNGSRYAQLEGRHGASDGNALRAAVLGANDGLVSTFCLLMGAAGAQFSGPALLTTALAGALAGAGSMAMGEWISVQSARELYARQIAAEADELEQAPEEEREELALIYQAKGFSAEEAQAISYRVMAQHGSALDTLVREELGINPDELGGSPWAAAGTSFAVFLLGAAVPALPLLVLSGPQAVLACVAASGLGLIGMGITLFTGGSAWRSGLRQLAIGAAAAALTYGAGRWLATGLG